MFDALKAADFSPIEQLIAAAVIVLTLIVPWWISATTAVALVGIAVWRIRSGWRIDSSGAGK